MTNLLCSVYMYMYIQDNLQTTMRRSTLFCLAFMSTEKPVYDDFVVQRDLLTKKSFLVDPMCVIFCTCNVFSE